MGFALTVGYIDHLQIVTTDSYGAIANSHNQQFTTTPTKSSQSAAFTSRCLVTASNTLNPSNSVSAASYLRWLMPILLQLPI
jgi:hypothetical protein